MSSTEINKTFDILNKTDQDYKKQFGEFMIYTSQKDVNIEDLVEKHEYCLKYNDKINNTNNQYLELLNNTTINEFTNQFS